MMEFLLGRLTWEALPHEWFTIGGTVSILGGMISVLAFLTYTKRWKWLWNEWLTTTDPKKIGIMYIIVAVLMLIRGALDAGLMWTQLAFFPIANTGFMNANHYQQIFTAHGAIMVIFVTMGFMFGLMNYIIPLQIGARDVAYPYINSFSFWLYVMGVILINMFFVLGGEYAATGWLSYPPLSELEFSPGVGVDYWIWSLQVSGLGTLLGGINILVTILRMRAPGMGLLKMPMFAWTTVCGMILIISTFPLLTATLTLLSLDRFMGMHFFTSHFGGNPMMYVNLIWMWGHPEVYILMIPAFGVYSEIVSTFSQKKLFGYNWLVWDALTITGFSALVWLHHFFTMGAGANVNAFFGLMTMIIAIPTGMQIFNWLFTMFRGRIHFTTPMLWFLGFVSTFSLGGMAGVMMSVPGIDFQVHNSLFLVAHFHTMAIGGALFGIFAAITYWWPKVTGFTLNERIGKYAFWCWIIGFFFSFVPLYILGFMGATRRLDHYDPATGWQPLFMTAAFGFVIISLGFVIQLIQIIVSIKQRKQHLDMTGDPWNGRSLEWSTSSPPPFYNFAIIPTVSTKDAFWEMKKKKPKQEKKSIKYEDIEMPKNTALGISVAGFIFLIGFGFVWHLLWLIAIGFIGAIALFLRRAFDEEPEYILPASEIAKIEERTKNNAR